MNPANRKEHQLLFFLPVCICVSAQTKTGATPVLHTKSVHRSWGVLLHMLFGCFCSFERSCATSYVLLTTVGAEDYEKRNMSARS